MAGHASPTAYLDDQFTYTHDQEDGSTRGLKVITSSCPGNRVYYAAAQVLGNGIGGEIFAIVCLVRWNPNDKEGMIFGYKDMDETMGPNEASCPEAILKLLTPTQNEHALDWRKRCLANLQRRSRKLQDGDRIKLPAPMKFTDGHEGDEFIVEKRGRRVVLRDPTSRLGYRISGFMERAWTVVPQTKVHKTIFA
jgi:hypothetical protein